MALPRDPISVGRQETAFRTPMNKRFLILLSVLLVGGGLVWLVRWNNGREVRLPAASEKERARAAARLNPNLPTQPEVVASVPITPSRPVRLAIGWLGLPDETQNLQVSDLLTVELTGAKGFELVDRQSFDAVLRELELNLSGLVRAKDAVRVGKLLKAEWFLLGNWVSAGASNAVIVRVVDARTGVLRNAGVFPYDGTSLGLAANLAAFVQQSRQPDNGSNPRVFLAVGTLQDLSVNSRQAGFPAQLRAQLIQAYQGSGVTLLEREYVSALLQEVRLDLAGLTETSSASLPPMQSAFWLVDGYYQSYETSGIEVELVLNIQRIFGRRTNVIVRDQPGQALVRKVKAEIDGALLAQAAALVPTRMTEAGAQMNAGRELLQPGTTDGGMVMGFLIHPWRGSIIDEQQEARWRRHAEEAIRAFQTVLLLEPTNRAAKIYLAAALRSQPLERDEEARPYYREVLDEPVKDKWVTIAQQALESTLRQATPEERARWLQPAALQATNPSAAFFERESRRAAVDAAIERGDGPNIQSLAEARLFETIAKFDAGNFYQQFLGMDAFVATFGQDRAAAARRLSELYPKMQAQTPNSAPYLLAAIVTLQVDTNAPVIAEFERALDGWAEHPEKVPRKIASFWNHIDEVYRWSQEHRLYGLGAKVAEAKQRAQGPDPAAPMDYQDFEKMELAFGYKAAHRWQDALRVFESYTNQPLVMGGRGPWGPAFTVLLTSKESAECRKQLGLPVVENPLEFDFGKPVLCLHAGGDTSLSQMLLTKFGAFATDANGLWVGIGGKLLQLDFSLRTNLVVPLPIPATTPITCLCPAPSQIWIGTGGAGLVRYDRASHQCTQLTEKDGLLMGFISALDLAGDVLWIGYGQESSGGLGKIDLLTRRATSFTPSLVAGPAGASKAPRLPVVSLAAGPAGDVWFVARFALGRYRSGTDHWETFPDLQPAAALASTDDKLFVGKGPCGMVRTDQPKGLGVNILALKEGLWKTFPAITGLPQEEVTTLTLDGPNVWVGGKGYVALVDPIQDKLLKFAYVRASSVDQIQLGGGCVWAHGGWHLYKAPLSALR